MKLKDIGHLLRETFAEWREDKAARLAAALAYYTVFSIAPLLVIVIGIAGIAFGRSAAEDRIVAQISQLTGSPSTAEAVRGMIAGAQSQKAGLVATVIGIATLLFGAAGVFGQLQESLNTIWEVEPKPNRGLWGLVKDRFLSFTMVLGIGFLLLVSLVITAALSGLDQFVAGWLPASELIFQVVNFAISLAVITLLFALIFKILPDVEIAWKDVWLGAAFTALLFTVGKLAIGLYLGKRGISDAYGAAGSLIVILLWVYYSAQILFFGGEFTQVYATHFGTRMKLERGARWLTGQARAEQGLGGGAPDARGSHGRWTPTVTSLPETLPLTGKTGEKLEPSMLAFSALAVVLAGFVSGLVVSRRKR